jgi:hypothetical protein
VQLRQFVESLDGTLYIAESNKLTIKLGDAIATLNLTTGNATMNGLSKKTEIKTFNQRAYITKAFAIELLELAN